MVHAKPAEARALVPSTHIDTTHTPSLINFKKKKKFGSLLNICVFLITNDSTSKLKNISFLFLFLYFYLVNSLIAIYFFLKKEKEKGK